MIKKSRRGFQIIRKLLPALYRASTDKDFSNLDELFNAADSLKGVIVKVLQVCLIVDEDKLSNKQLVYKIMSHISPYCFEQIEKILNKKYECGYQNIFKDFEKEAFAAASLGQVHRAQFGDQKVVVKIQYPGIRENTKVDLYLLEKIIPILLQQSTGINFKNNIREITQEYLSELDYKREAYYQNLFKELLSISTDIKVPQAHIDISSENILVSDYIEGETLCIVGKQSIKANEKVTRNLLHSWLLPIIKTNHFYTDPHPGNFIISRSGDLHMIDFGSVKKIPEDFKDDYLKIISEGISLDILEKYIRIDPRIRLNEKKNILNIVNQVFALIFEPFRKNEKRYYSGSRYSRDFICKAISIRNELRQYKINFRTNFFLMLRGSIFFVELINNMETKLNYYEILKEIENRLT